MEFISGVVVSGVGVSEDFFLAMVQVKNKRGCFCQDSEKEKNRFFGKNEVFW